MNSIKLEEIRNELDRAYSVATEEGNYEKAIELCDAIIQAHPTLSLGLRKRAAVHAYMGDFEQAIRDITLVIRKGSREPDDFFFRGWWLLDNGDEAQAVEDLTTAIDLGSESNFDDYSESAYFFRAVALLRLHRYGEALMDCQHVREDFVMYIRTGQISRADIIKEATARTITP